MLNLFYDRIGDYENKSYCNRIPNGIPKNFVEFYWPNFDVPKFRAHTTFEPAVYPSDLYRDDNTDFANIWLIDDIEEKFKDTNGCLGIYPIELFGAPDRAVGMDKSWNSKFKTTFDYISQKALTYIKDGKLKLYFGLLQEAFYQDETFKYLDYYLSKYDISDVVVCVNDFSLQRRYTDWCKNNNKKIRFKVIVYCHSLFEKAGENYSVDQNDWHGVLDISREYEKHTSSVMKLDEFYSTKDELRNSNFLCLNRRMRPHRLSTLCILSENNLIENNDVSFTFKLDPVSFYIEEFFINNHRKRQLKPEFDKLREMKTKIVDYPIAMEARDGINHGYGWENHKPYLNNYFSIVTETLYFQGGGYCSEKIWKPFAYFHPIILVGSPGSLKYVREFGFKTFHPFIDETYDECLDGRERFSLIEKEIVKINSMTKEELHKWYWEMEDILVHNYKLFMEYGKNNRDIRGGFLYLLEQEINNQDLVGYTYLPKLK